MNDSTPVDPKRTGSRRSVSSKQTIRRKREQTLFRRSQTYHQETRRSTRAKNTQHTHPYRGSYAHKQRSTTTNPSLWTKDASSSSGFRSILVKIAYIIAAGALAIFKILATVLVFCGRAVAAFASRSRKTFAITILAGVLLIGGIIDFGWHYGKAYPGVMVGEIEAQGKTADQLEQEINEVYGPRLDDTTVVIYASEKAQKEFDDKAAAAQSQALAEQLSVDDAQSAKSHWSADASSLGASLPARTLAEEAVNVGRKDGGIFARFVALFSWRNIEPRAEYEESSLEALAKDIDATIGEPRKDFNIKVTDGKAKVVKGHDGDMVNRSSFENSLNQAFFTNSKEQNSFVATTEHAPLRITEEQAQTAADTTNQAISGGARFTYANKTWDTTPEELGGWVKSTIKKDGKNYQLSVSIDESLAKPSILTHAVEATESEPINVTFKSKKDKVTVITDGTKEVPLVAKATKQLNAALFAEEGKANRSPNDVSNKPVDIAIKTGTAPEKMSLDEALGCGVVEPIASYTTKYSTGTGTENRNHNIELVSKLLSNSIVKPGGSWSFNTTAGDCSSTERGFLDAGAIINGDYQDAVGGGICQVATTMFNAVFEAGYPVTSRSNHSLYIASYPEGRDAAVSWPDLDFVWENDGESDVLVRLSCTDGAVTATLYGVNPGYQVTSDVGEWSKGKTYETRTEVDEKLEPGTSYVKTYGTDGSKITVIRTVCDESGNVLREDTFHSVYDPVTEVIVKGPDTDAEA